MACILFGALSLPSCTSVIGVERTELARNDVDVDVVLAISRADGLRASDPCGTHSGGVQEMFFASVYSRGLVRFECGVEAKGPIIIGLLVTENAAQN